MRQMNLSRFIILLTVSFLLLSCGVKVQKVPPKSSIGKADYGKPYIIRGIKYYPLKSVSDFAQKGIASWYGREEHGKLTSSGERFDMYGLTAAHKTLPLGSMVLVKNLENSKELVVRINDRGPFVAGRIIDLSYKGAKELGFVEKGTANVKIELLSENQNKYVYKGKDVDLDSGNFYIQLGSFKNYDNAVRLKNSFSNAVIREFMFNSEKFYRVWVGNFNSNKLAENNLRRLSSNYPQAFVVAE